MNKNGELYITQFMRPPGIWYGMKYSVRCISPLWQPLTYFLPFILPYNSSENIINYARKSRWVAGNTVKEEKEEENEEEGLRSESVEREKEKEELEKYSCVMEGLWWFPFFVLTALTESTF